MIQFSRLIGSMSGEIFNERPSYYAFKLKVPAAYKVRTGHSCVVWSKSHKQFDMLKLDKLKLF